MSKLQEKLQASTVIFDGAMGTELYRRNFFVNASYEQLCLTAPDVVREIHCKYFEAGADVLTTNTYNANVRSLARFGIADQCEAINKAAVRLAREAAQDKALVAASVGPISQAESPDDKAEKKDLLISQISALSEADFILFETISAPGDVEAALVAMDAFPGREYVLSFAIEAAEEADAAKLMDKFISMVTSHKGNSPVALGLNCGNGPEQMLKNLELFRTKTDLPIVVQPNAGGPREVEGRHLYMGSAEYFTTYARRYTQLGAAAVGGCCGIGPEHITELARSLKPLLRAERGNLPEVEIKQELCQPEIPLAERSGVGAKLAAGEWLKLVEITPPKGFDLTKTIAGAKKCKENGIDAVNLPDGPRASARIAALAAAIAIQQNAGIEAILHCCCRDRSLLGLQSLLLGCAGSGVNSLLFITGDPPKLGDYPFSSGVFDVDSIGLVKMQKLLNSGVDIGGQPISQPTSAVIGVGADPNAIDFEREYRRTCEKVEAGAEFIITQPVFAVDSLFKFLDRIGHLHIPVIAGVWPLTSLKNAQFMQKEVPGVVVPDEVMKRMAASDDRDTQRAEGIAIARESIAAIRSRVQGVQVSAPFGNVDAALKVILD